MPDWVERYHESQRGQKGGPGSGHFGHAGRPGKRGGSVPGSVAVSVRTGRTARERQEAASWVGKAARRNIALPKTRAGQAIIRAVESDTNFMQDYTRGQDVARYILDVIKEKKEWEGLDSIEDIVASFPEHWETVGHSPYGYEVRREDFLAMRDPGFRQHVEGLAKGKVFGKHAAKMQPND